MWPLDPGGEFPRLLDAVVVMAIATVLGRETGMEASKSQPKVGVFLGWVVGWRRWNRDGGGIGG